MAREHEKSSRNQVLPLPGRTGEPGTGNDARTFGPDVITALRLLGEVINEGRTSGRLTVRRASRCKAEDWIWSAVLMTQYEAL
jgi:hypothetical protein